MRFAKQVIGIALIVFLLTTTAALAVGYERRQVNGPSDVTSTEKAKTPQSVVNAVREASFIDKFPACLDSVAGIVKDLLGQFGLVQSNTP